MHCKHCQDKLGCTPQPNNNSRKGFGVSVLVPDTTEHPGVHAPVGQSCFNYNDGHLKQCYADGFNEVAVGYISSLPALFFFFLKLLNFLERLKFLLLFHDEH